MHLGTEGSVLHARGKVKPIIHWSWEWLQFWTFGVLYPGVYLSILYPVSRTDNTMTFISHFKTFFWLLTRAVRTRYLEGFHLAKWRNGRSIENSERLIVDRSKCAIPYIYSTWKLDKFSKITSIRCHLTLLLYFRNSKIRPRWAKIGKISQFHCFHFASMRLQKFSFTRWQMKMNKLLITLIFSFHSLYVSDLR